MAIKMVVIETIDVKGHSILRIKRIRKVQNREKRSNPDTMVSLHVTNMVGDISISI